MDERRFCIISFAYKNRLNVQTPIFSVNVAGPEAFDEVIQEAYQKLIEVT